MLQLLTGKDVDSMLINKHFLSIFDPSDFNFSKVVLEISLDFFRRILILQLYKYLEWRMDLSYLGGTRKKKNVDDI